MYAERTFESFHNIIRQKQSILKTKELCTKIKSRYHSIKDLVRHWIIDKKKFKDILNR